MKRCLPPPIRRTLLWLWVLPLLALPPGVYLVATGSHVLLFVGLLFLSNMAGQVMTAISTVRLRRRLRRAEGLMCMRCGFDLTGLEHVGRCPECGEGFDAQTPGRWRELVRY